MEKNEKTIKTCSVCGIIGFLLLFLVILLNTLLPTANAKTTEEFLIILSNPPNGTLLMGLIFLFGGFGLLAIVALLGLNRFLVSERSSLSVTVATVYGCIAFTIITIMLLIQGTVNIRVAKIVAGLNEIERQAIIKIYQSLRSVDFGFDLGFYIFISISILLLGIVMFRSRHFGPVFAVPGILIGIALLTINLVTALVPSSRSNLMDICFLWYLIVYIQMLRKAKFMSGGA